MGCLEWCSKKQDVGCCQWGKRTGNEYEYDTCNFASGVSRARSRQTAFDRKNKVSICKTEPSVGEDARTVEESEEASVGAACNCDGGMKNSAGRGGSDCSGAGNNGVPWCYVGVRSGCTDLKGDPKNPWSEQACAKPSNCAAMVTGACDARLNHHSWTPDSGLHYGGPQNKEECLEWCSKKQDVGCCQWGKRTGNEYEYDTCNFASGVSRARSRQTAFDRKNKVSICKTELSVGEDARTVEEMVEAQVGQACTWPVSSKGYEIKRGQRDSSIRTTLAECIERAEAANVD